QNLSRGRRHACDILSHTLLFLYRMMKRFVEDGGLERAGSLAYTTLLSLVPLMTVVFAILSAFPVAEKVSDVVQEFIFRNFMPASGEVVHQYLLEFSSKASRLSGVGFLALLVVAVMLMATIDKTFNAIWSVKRKRRPLNMFLVYWAVLSMGPVLMGASVLATSYLVSLPMVSEATASSVGRSLLEWVPTLTSGVAFTLLYWLVPNRPVKFWHAALGGALAAVLFEFSKQGFAWYLTTFPTYEAIYGALAAIPIFLVWIYVSWVVVLLGAEFTYGLGVYRQMVRHGENTSAELENMLCLLLQLARAQEKGEAVPLRKLLHCSSDAEHLLIRLRERHLVECNEKGRWLLARDSHDVTLYELYLAADHRLPVSSEPAWPSNPALQSLYQKVDTSIAEILGDSLQSLKKSA
ncbi:virulence factor BrkB family protein, partial [Thiolapillus sp.]